MPVIVEQTCVCMCNASLAMQHDVDGLLETLFFLSCATADSQ